MGGRDIQDMPKIKTKLEWHGISNIIFAPEMGQTRKNSMGKLLDVVPVNTWGILIKTKLEWHGISNIIFKPEMVQT